MPPEMGTLKTVSPLKCSELYLGLSYPSYCFPQTNSLFGDPSTIVQWSTFVLIGVFLYNTHTLQFPITFQHIEMFLYNTHDLEFYILQNHFLPQSWNRSKNCIIVFAWKDKSHETKEKIKQNCLRAVSEQFTCSPFYHPFLIVF